MFGIDTGYDDDRLSDDIAEDVSNSYPSYLDDPICAKIGCGSINSDCHDCYDKGDRGDCLFLEDEDDD